MILYHGSNIEVRKPEIQEKRRSLDFGNAFYLTSSEDQAIKWAKAVTCRRKDGMATLNKYEIDEVEIKGLRCLKFDKANDEWLDFVVLNRCGVSTNMNYDIVI